MRIIQGIAQRKSEDTGWWGRQCFTGAPWLSQLPLTHPSPRWGVRPSPAGWSARTASPEQVAGRRLRPAGSGCFEGCTFDEVNLGKYLLHLYHLFRDACIEALGLLLPWSIVLSITLIRVLNLPGTMYFSLIFNFFLPGSTAYTQNLSFKAKQKRKKEKASKVNASLIGGRLQTLKAVLHQSLHSEDLCLHGKHEAQRRCSGLTSHI